MLGSAAMSCQRGHVRRRASMAASLFPYKALPLSPSASISAVDGVACRDKADGRNLRKWRDSNGIFRGVDMQIAVEEVPLLAEEQVAEETFQIDRGVVDAFYGILVVGADKGVAEVPRVFGK